MNKFNQPSDHSEVLSGMYPFSEDVLAAVDTANDKLRHLPFERIVDEYRVEQSKGSFQIDGGKPVEYLDLRRDEEEDTVIVQHLSHATGLDQNWILHTIHLAATNPTKRIVTFGNVTSVGNKNGKLSVRDSVDMAISRNAEKKVKPVVQYVENAGIEDTAQVGISNGASLAVLTAAAAHNNFGVSQIVPIEPVPVKKRLSAAVAAEFILTGRFQQEYIDMNDMKAFSAFWDDNGAEEFIRYMGGMVKLTNLASIRVMSGESFFPDAKRALDTQPANIAIGHCTKSGIVQIPELLDKTHELSQQYPGRVSEMVFTGARHATVDYIPFYSAAITAGLEQTARTS